MYINNFFSKKIKIKEENNLIIINIKKDITIKEIYKILTFTKYSYLKYIINEKELTKEKYNINEQIIISKNENNIYIIRNSKEIIKIIKTSINFQEKNIIIINKSDMTYKTNIDSKNKTAKIQAIIEELFTIKNVQDYINQKEITDILNIVLKKNYFPIIKSNRITLSWPNRYGSTDIHAKIRATLDIILNETSEKIGEITYNYMYNPKLSYTGNVSYKIKEEFQNKGYATEALFLLKEVLKKHQNKERDLYISTDIGNTKSQKVAINNEGKLYFEGEIPKSDSLTKRSGITKIKMYQIKID